MLKLADEWSFARALSFSQNRSRDHKLISCFFIKKYESDSTNI